MFDLRQFARCRHSNLARSLVMRLCLMLILSTCTSLSVAASKIHDVRLWPSPDKTRVVFDLDSPVDHKVFPLQNPSRVVIDIQDVSLQLDTSKLELKDTPIRLIRTAKQGKTGLRVVLDLEDNVNVKSFLLKKSGKADDRLVVDLNYLKAGKPKKTVTKSAVAQQQQKRDLIVAIDAGHGGEDPGALGPGKVYEKRVVYAIAKKLADKFNREKGYKAVMVRTGDYYVGLNKRRDIAREKRADMFISIHADAFTSPKAHGASVYALSGRGASSASAKFLADKENQSDLIGGISISDKDHVLSSVLLDLSMTYKMDASLEVGRYVLKEMDKLTKLHSKRVEQAAFAVLKTPDIPSILVETGFISNPKEAKNLNSRNYQAKMAAAIFNGVSNYFQVKAPEGSYIAAKHGSSKRDKRYIVERGDTLSGIADRYAVSMTTLRKHNRLRSSELRVGQVLKIPSI